MFTKRLIAIAAASLILSACSESESETNNFVSSSAANNVAALFMGDMEGIPGVMQDPLHVEQMLTNPQYNFGFRLVQRQQSGETLSQITARSAALAQQALADPNATFFWYFSGHGSEDGSLIASDQPFQFKSVANAMRSARGNQAFKRLIVLVDACYSGNIVNGNGAISNALALAPGVVGGAGLPDEGVGAAANSKYLEALNLFANSVVSLRAGLYDELILVASSRSTETSGDSDTGGVGTNAFMQSMAQMAMRPGSTVQELLQTMVPMAMGQTPVYRVEPQQLLGATVFGGDNSYASKYTPYGPNSAPYTPTNDTNNTNANNGGIFDVFFGVR